MNILITGGNGFVARNIHKAIKDTHNIFLTNRQTLDVLDRDQVDKFFDDNQIDIVIHTAVSGGSRTREDGVHTLVDNLVMFNNLIENKHKFRSLIHFGSGAEFDRRTDITSAKEDKESSPSDYYGLSKRIIKTEIDKTKGFYNFRLFGCFGEDEDDTRFIKSAIKNIIKNDPVVIHQDKIMDYIYIGDVIKVIKYYIENISNKTLIKDLDMCYNKKNSLIEIAQYLINISGKECKMIINQEGQSNEYTGDSGNMQNLNIQFDGLWKSIDKVYNYLKEGK